MSLVAPKVKSNAFNYYEHKLLGIILNSQASGALIDPA